jgi:uncharacterized protein with FMN-binding domain
MIKRLLAVVLAASCLISACLVEYDPFGDDSGRHEPYGNFTGSVNGSAMGFHGEVSVTLALVDGYITGVEILGHETPGIGSVAVDQAPTIIVSRNSVELDTLSGASITTKAIRAAGEQALAKVDPSLGGSSEMSPGTYIVTANGFEGPFTVLVTVGPYTITHIATDEVNESINVGQPAIPILIDRILKAQTTAVDSVSGASITSTALKTAVNKALQQAGAPSSFTTVPQMPDPIDRSQQTVDVLVIGSGAAGLSAAIEAAKQLKVLKPGFPPMIPAGGTVVLIEKEELLGGSTKLSAGLIYAPVNGGDKTTLADYFMFRAQGYANSALIDFYAQNSLDVIDSFIGASNIMMTIPAGMASAARSRMVNGQGPGLMNILTKKATDEGVIILPGIKATQLEKNNTGEVVRVRANSRTSNYIFNVNRGVVIATGGFDSDHSDLLNTHNPDSKEDIPRSSHGNVGEGITMGVAVGAATVFKGGKIGWGIIDPSLNIDIMAGANIITRDGDNLDLTAPTAGTAQSGFSLSAVTWNDSTHNSGYTQNEGADYPPMFTGFMRARAIERGITFWQISNTPFSATSFTSGGFVNQTYLEDHNLAYHADTIEDLAEHIGLGALDPTKLEARFTERGWVSGPFYAWKVQPSSIGSMGGLKINTKGEVLAENTSNVTDPSNFPGFSPIPGLYAAGEVANGDFYYQQYPASGSSLSLAITFGREAGKNAASASDHAPIIGP